MSIDTEWISNEMEPLVALGFTVLSHVLIAAVGLWMFWPSVKDKISVVSIGGVGVAYGIVYYLMVAATLPKEAEILNGVYIGVFVAYSRLMGIIMSANESYKIVGDVILFVTHGKMLVWLILWLVNPMIVIRLMPMMMAIVMHWSEFAVILTMVMKEYKKVLVCLGVIASGAFVQGFVRGLWPQLTLSQGMVMFLGVSTTIVTEVIAVIIVMLLLIVAGQRHDELKKAIRILGS